MPRSSSWGSPGTILHQMRGHAHAVGCRSKARVLTHKASARQGEDFESSTIVGCHSFNLSCCSLHKKIPKLHETCSKMFPEFCLKQSPSNDTGNTAISSFPISFPPSLTLVTLSFAPLIVLHCNLPVLSACTEDVRHLEWSASHVMALFVILTTDILGLVSKHGHICDTLYPARPRLPGPDSCTQDISLRAFSVQK